MGNYKKKKVMGENNMKQLYAKSVVGIESKGTTSSIALIQETSREGWDDVFHIMASTNDFDTRKISHQGILLHYSSLLKLKNLIEDLEMHAKGLDGDASNYDPFEQK